MSNSDRKLILKNPASHSFHFLAERDGHLLEMLTELMSQVQPFTHEDAMRLLEFGASYLNFERMLADANVKSGDYLRVHHPPKRYTINDIDWQSRVVFENSDFLILNKPAGIPTHATLDNYSENVMVCLEKLYQQPLFITQRLDQPTQGLMTIAKSKAYQSHFNRLLREKKIEKKYRALIATAPEETVPSYVEFESHFLSEPAPRRQFSNPQKLLGLHTHFMRDIPYPPRQVLHYQPVPEPHNRHVPSQKPWMVCQLEVVKMLAPSNEFSLCREWSEHFPKANTQVVEILLLTGRPHQIRTQLAYGGFPILGDKIYGSPVNVGNRIALQSCFLKFEEHEFAIN